MKLAIAAALLGALTSTTALADISRSDIRQAFVADGYDDIRIWRQGGRWMVSAERGDDEYTFRVNRSGTTTVMARGDADDDTPRRGGNRAGRDGDDDRDDDRDDDDRDDDRDNDRDNGRDDRDDDRDDRGNDRDDDRDDDRGDDRDGDDD